MHRAWINIKSAVTNRDRHAILAEAERGEDSAVDAYKDALEENLPAPIKGHRHSSGRRSENRARQDSQPAGRCGAEVASDNNQPLMQRRKPHGFRLFAFHSIGTKRRVVGRTNNIATRNRPGDCA
jgi:hypothetical protein